MRMKFIRQLANAMKLAPQPTPIDRQQQLIHHSDEIRLTARHISMRQNFLKTHIQVHTEKSLQFTHLCCGSQESMIWQSRLSRTASKSVVSVSGSTSIADTASCVALWLLTIQWKQTSLIRYTVINSTNHTGNVTAGLQPGAGLQGQISQTILGQS